MKKFITLLACVSALSYAGNAQVSFGPAVGLNLANNGQKMAGTKISTKMVTGVHVGGVAKINFTDNLFLMPGVFFSTKGSKFDVGGADMKTSLSYIEIPVNLGYSIASTGIFITAGPYLGYAVGGKFKVGDESENIKFGSDETKDDLKPMDLGINVGAGYQLPLGIFVKAQYGIGLANLAPGGNSDNSIKNSVIGITVGMLFGGK